MGCDGLVVNEEYSNHHLRVELSMRNVARSNAGIWVWVILYLVAHGGILLIPNAIYWDDWVLYRADPIAVIERFTQQAGTMFYLEGHLHLAMLSAGTWLYKSFTFVLMFASGMLLNLILKRHERLSDEVRFFVVLLFLLLPFNMARVALVDFRYTACYFLFFLAWFLVERHRVLALVLFFLSFNTNSLLVFYAAPILDLMYRRGHISSWKSILNFSIKYVDFMALPFIYFVIKIYYFSPTGLYSGYNQGYSLKNLMYLPLFQLSDLFATSVSIGLTLFLSLCSFLLIRRTFGNATHPQKNPWSLLALGLFVFILGAFPYWILGLLPTFGEWSSRHQLLLPLGSALIIVALSSFDTVGGKTVVISIFVGASLAHNMSSYASLFGDWQKQQQLIGLFSQNSDIEQAELILIEDKSTKLNALNRNYRFYEWNGILEVAFGNEKHFAIDRSEYERYMSGYYDTYFSSSYKAGSFQRDAVSSQVLVKIELIEPDRFSARFQSIFYPQFNIFVTKLDAAVQPTHLH